MKKKWIITLLSVGLLWLLPSCNRNRDIVPSMDFSPYISAYTGGFINSDAPIRIVLTQDMDSVETGKALEKKLFSFSPSLKGNAYWEDSHTIAFVPDDDGLKPGKHYRAEFNLSKLMPVSRKLRKFPFSFQVRNREFTLQVNPIEVTDAHADDVTLHGEIAFNEPVSLKEVKKMLDAEGYPVVFSDNRKGSTYSFTVSGIDKKEYQQTIRLTANGRPVGVKEKISVSVTIPQRNSFRYISYQRISSPENGIRLVFSEPLSTTQDLRGLIELKEISGYNIRVKDNLAEIYFEEPDNSVSDSIRLRIDESLQNSSRSKLGYQENIYVKVKVPAPEVALLSDGVILPDAENLKLHFKAVSLQAVDISVVRIYQNNILSFLQTNKLDEDEDIRRAGRLVYRSRLLLNPNPSAANSWQNYSIDLAKFFRQEEGAMYRVQLSFKREYASAPFNRELLQKEERSGMVPLKRAVSEKDEEAWDEVGSYYTYFGYPYEDYSDYYEHYRWRDRNNPYTVSYYMEDRSVATNLLASNLGVIVKANESGSYWVAVNDILTTDPVRGAEVSLYNLQLQKLVSGKTDSKGQAELECTAKPFIAVVSKGKQSTYLRLVDGENNSYSRFDVGGEKLNKGLKGFIYGERGIWRPGDTLFLTLILEDKKQKLPDNHPASLELFNPNGQFFCRKVNNNSTNGFYTFSIPTPTDAPTGLWHAYVSIGQATFHKALHIETVKPNRLKIDLKLPSAIINARKAAPATIQAAWLTGATASNLPAEVEMTLSKDRTPFKGFEKYVFINPLADFPRNSQKVFEGRLNGSGTAQMELKPLASNILPGKLNAQFVCRVSEEGGDVSTVSKNAVLSPYSTYVGIRSNLSESYPYIETNTKHVFDIVAVSETGKLVPCSLEYVIYKINWSYWWENQEDELSNYVNSSSAKKVGSGIKYTSTGKTTIPIQIDYPEWGKYMIYVRDLKGGHASGFLFNVDWPSWRGNPDAKNPSAVQMLAFSLDKKEYQVGEKVMVTIPNMTSGVALVSIENGSEVLATHRVNINSDGTTNFHFKVTEEMAPNAYVQISLLQPHHLTTDNMPIRLYGVEPFAVTDPETRLEPQITCPAVIRPQTPFTIQVKEKSKRPMTYTLAVVDEGLLGLTNYRTPDPWNNFYSREALGIRTWDMYNHVVGAFSGNFARMFSVGGDENLEISPAKANRFNAVVRFIGPFTLKKGETKSHNIRLPQYVGAVRVMVVAAQDGAYGSAEKGVTVRAPLMLLPSLPRVLSVSEQVELPVNVFAMEPSVKEVKVTVRTEGKARVKGSATQTVRFSQTGDKLVLFSLETGQMTGKEKITVTATGNGQSAKEVIEIEVRNPNPIVTSTQSFLINPKESASLPYNLKNSGKENLLQLEVSTLPTVRVSDIYDFLGDYRHLCSEQLVSKALPLLYKEVFTSLTDAEKKQLQGEIRSAISQLYARQLPSGGFTYWPGTEDVSEWLTSYAGHFLILAREKGYEVNTNVINQWLGYQRKSAQNWQMKRKNAAGYSFTQSDLEQAYRLYTLALAGKAETGAMNRLKGRNDLSQQARWRLAAAYAVAGKKKTALELIQKLPKTVPAYSSDNSTFGSPLRDEAMILETMILTDKNKEAFQQAQLLAQTLKNEAGYSTHSSAYALLALAQLYDKFSGSLAFDWKMNQNAFTQVKAGKSAYCKRLPVNPLSGQVVVRNNGTGKLYASLYQRSRPLKDSTPAQNRNLSIHIRYNDMNGNPIKVSQLQQGTEFTATIRVSNIHPSQSYRNVALACILPTGWEVINERYLEAAGSGANNRISYQDIRDDRVLAYFDLPKQTYQEVTIRLRASYCGNFLLPAVRCEAMYDPQTFARTAAGRTIVIR